MASIERHSNVFEIEIDVQGAKWTGTPFGTYYEHMTGRTISGLNELSEGEDRTFSVGTPVPSQIGNASISGDTITFDTLNVFENMNVKLPIVVSNAAGSNTVFADITIMHIPSFAGWIVGNKAWIINDRMWGFS